MHFLGQQELVQFPHGTEVRFDCVKTSLEDPDDDSDEDEGNEVRMQSWKIMCEDGEWIGKYIGCNEDGTPMLNEGDEDESKFNLPCEYVPPEDPEESKRVAFFGDR